MPLQLPLFPGFFRLFRDSHFFAWFPAFRRCRKMQRKLGYAKTSAHPTYESLLREALLPVQLLLCMERSREQNPQRLLRLTGALNNLELLLAEEMRDRKSTRLNSSHRCI